MKQINLITISLFLLSIFLIAISCNDSNAKPNNKNSKQDVDLVKNTILTQSVTQKNKTNSNVVSNDTITIIGVGDMMLGTNYPASPNYLPKNNNCNTLLEPVIDILKDADVTFGNCEGVFSDDIRYVKKCNSPKNCYRFSMPESYAKCFVNAGFDVVSIANNHLGDLGAYGRKNTVKVLKENKIHFAGLTDYPSIIFEKNGVKYGFCAFAPNSGTCQITDIPKAKNTVKKLKEKCDIVIVSFHGGAEGRNHQHVTRKYETFLGHNRGNVYDFAHSVIDAGADIVFGHGPHVTRAIDIYKERFIIYSMGNFCTYRRFNLTGPSGIAPIIKLYVDKNGKFLKGKITPIYQDKMTGTKLDPQKRAISKIRQLTKKDFPEVEVNITNEGDILIRN